MRKDRLFLLLLLCLSLVSSCSDGKHKDPQKKLTEKEKADLERASFDKLPNHNDSVVGCWLIDSIRSVRLREDMDIDALFFLEKNKKLVVLDSSKNNEYEEKIGFFRFYNNELTFEITSTGEPFEYRWKTTFDGDQMIAQNKKKPNAFLYLTRVEGKSSM